MSVPASYAVFSPSAPTEFCSVSRQRYSNYQEIVEKTTGQCRTQDLRCSSGDVVVFITNAIFSQFICK